MPEHNHSHRSTPPRAKRLGGYLVEAGLLTPAQIDVALNDQQITGMRFGEILAARGWVKQQTIEYLMQKVILPEQEAVRSQPPTVSAEEANTDLVRGKKLSDPTSNGQTNLSESANNHSTDHRSHHPLTRRDVPIAKPLPSVAASDDEVNWVG